MFLVVPISVLVVSLSNYYLKIARELKRLESISRSPVFAHFSETLIGLDREEDRQVLWMYFTGMWETLSQRVVPEPINVRGTNYL